MASISVYNSAGLNLRVNPLLIKSNDLLRSVNVDNNSLGAKQKRPGFVQFLNNPDNAQVNSHFSWDVGSNGTQSYLYRVSGSVMYYYDVTAGTATTWFPCGGGTFSANAHVGRAVLENTMIVGDGVGSTRYTTNGTSFTSMALAPIGQFFVDYQQRIYIGGTANTLFWSTTGDATNWSTSGTSDSSSIQISGEGIINGVEKIADRVVVTKTTGNILRWDGYQLTDDATKLGASSPYSFDKTEGVGFSFNRLGIFSSGGDRPQQIANAIQPFIYNSSNSGIVGSVFDNAPGAVFNYDYLLSVGSTTEDITYRTLTNGVIKYDFQSNWLSTHDFAVTPTAMKAFVNNTRNTSFVFGDATGKTYLYGGTARTDNGTAIESELMYLTHFGVPHLEKKFNFLTAFFNPGCQAHVQVAITDTFRKNALQWTDLGDATSGTVNYRFESGSQGNLLLVKIVDRSRDAQFDFYGFSVDADVQERRI